MTRIAASLVLLGIYCSAGCGPLALDLDHAAPVASTPSDAEAPFMTGRVTGIWIEEQRFYWLSAEKHLFDLQSCLTADCNRTKLSYAKATSAAVADGHVYWTSNFSISSCAAEGCQGDPTRLAEDPLVSARPIFGYRDYVYWCSDFYIYRCPATGCADTPEIVAANTVPSELAFDEERVYWVGSLGIMSGPSDGSELPKLVTRELGILSLAISAGYLYWATDEYTARCPLTDCASATTRLVAVDAPVIDLKVDDSRMYWLAADAIHSCPLTGCEKSVVLTPPNVAKPNDLNRSAAFAIDASYLYWLEEHDPGPILQEYPHGKSIRRIAK